CTLIHVSMELGGHAPFIICHDADIDFAVTQALASKFRNAGQTCVCANRFIVHQSVIQEFSEKFAAATKALKMGNGLDAKTDVGPLINKKGFDKVVSQIENAKSNGATILAGGTYQADDEKGIYFVAPTVLGKVTLEMDIMSEETFGHVSPIIAFNTLDEAIEIANGTPFGLAAYYFTYAYMAGFYLTVNLDYGLVGWMDGYK